MDTSDYTIRYKKVEPTYVRLSNPTNDDEKYVTTGKCLKEPIKLKQKQILMFIDGFGKTVQ